MALNLARLSPDWQAKYGHPIVLVESFVDLEWFRGTAYKASGWQAVGTTAGFKRVAQDFYEAHERPKQLFVKELVKNAARGLRARQLPARWGAQEQPIERRCLLDKERIAESLDGASPASAREPGCAGIAASAGHGVGHRLCLSVERGPRAVTVPLRCLPRS